ncbi:MAG TPA: CvpA family protein [Terriglobia bacterium]|nr:CvpA family protein [Terriglobia bacterium]
MANWNWLDWVLAAIVLLSVITAIFKGFVGELISLASVVAAVGVAILNYGRLAPDLEDLTRSHAIALGISFLLLFFGTLLIGAFVAALARKLIQRAELQWFDRFLGGIFGLVRGVLVDCIVLLILMAFAIKGEAVQESTLAPYITSGSRLIAIIMPREVKRDFQAGFERFRLTLHQADKKTLENQSSNPTNF